MGAVAVAEYLKRVVTYCPRIREKVNREFSFRIVNGNKEFSSTCTGIKDYCDDCFIVKNDEDKIRCFAKAELS